MCVYIEELMPRELRKNYLDINEGILISLTRKCNKIVKTIIGRDVGTPNRHFICHRSVNTNTLHVPAEMTH